MTDGPIRLNKVTRAAVDSGRLVHLATINPDGTASVTCVYAGWDGDKIVAGHLADHLKLRNIRRDPRVTLSVESDVPFEGFSPYLVIKGIARVEEGGAVDALRKITNGQFPPPGDNYPAGFVTRIFAAQDLWHRPLGSHRLSVQPTAARASSARRKVDSSTGLATATDAVRRKSMDIATKGVEVTRPPGPLIAP